MVNKTTKKKEKTDKISLLADILTRLATSDTSFGVSELGREHSKNKMYIHRLLSSLESIGWATKDPISQKYKVGDELVNFGLLLTYRFSIPKITIPYLYELSDITNETTALSIRIGYERLFVQEVPAKHDHHRTVILGQRYPLWLGATGKSMAAYLSDVEIDELVNIMRRELPTFNIGRTFNTDQYRNDLKEIKKKGYAMTLGDYRPDICVLAAPIFGNKQKVVGSLVVRGQLPSFNLEIAKKYGTVIMEMTNNITREIQGIA
jgi:IclR family transcriptional regulator, KDG regulon repressor